MRAAPRRYLPMVIGTSVALRVLSALVQGDVVTVLPGTADQVSYHALAVRLLGGHGFSFDTGWWPATAAGEPTAHWSFLYVGALAAIYGLAGEHPLAARLVQAIAVGLLQPLLAWRIGRLLFGERTGLTAAALCASYGYFIYYAGALVTESLYIVAVLWTVHSALRLGAPPGRPEDASGMANWVSLGLACATAVLLRQVFLLCVPLILGWVVWRTLAHRTREGARASAAAPAVLGRVSVVAVILVLAVVPWTIRNYRVFDELVLLNTNAGFAFFWGNHPVHGQEFVPILPGDGAQYGELIPDDLRGLNEAALDRALLRQGVAFVLADLPRFARLSAGRAREYVKFWPSPESSLLSNVVRVFSFGVWLPFMAAGMVLVMAGAAGTGQADRSGAALVLLIAGVYALVHVLTWALVRYRLPVDALLLLFAAVSLVWLSDQLGARRSRSVPEDLVRATRSSI